MTIRPSGEESTMTRKQLLACRDAEAKRLREKWAEWEGRKTSCNITLSGHRSDLHKHRSGTV